MYCWPPATAWSNIALCCAAGLGQLCQYRHHLHPARDLRPDQQDLQQPLAGGCVAALVRPGPDPRHGHAHLPPVLPPGVQGLDPQEARPGRKRPADQARQPCLHRSSLVLLALQTAAACDCVNATVKCYLLWKCDAGELSVRVAAQHASREQSVMWYHYWHRLVGTAGAWFFWCGPRALCPSADALLFCRLQVVCHDKVRLPSGRGFGSLGTPCPECAVFVRARRCVQGRVFLRQQAVPVHLHQHHRAGLVHPDWPALDAAELFCGAGACPAAPRLMYNICGQHSY
jgi:hypothetical protein